MNRKQWNPEFAAEFEAVRRQRGSRHGRRHSHTTVWSGPGGPPPWLAQMFGPQWTGQPGGPRGGGRRPRVRRGDVRVAILDVLARAAEDDGASMNGYQVIQQIAERSNDAWRPSPGSVYPTISQLQDEGLVEDAPAGRKAIQLTEDGRAWAAANVEEREALWRPFDETPAEEEDAGDLRQVIGQTVGAIIQVVSTGTPDQREKAIKILAETRRQMYGLLAEGPDPEDRTED